jgi:hypothetical protein
MIRFESTKRDRTVIAICTGVIVAKLALLV